MVAGPKRDNFKAATRTLIGRRVGFRCSNPACLRATVGPAPGDNLKAIDLGVAAHIGAAAPGGPRYDPNATPEHRSSEANALWLCQNCAKLIDSDTTHYTAALLLEWKDRAVDRAMREIFASGPALVVPGSAVTAIVDIDVLKAAARADISRFKSGPTWPNHPVQRDLILDLRNSAQQRVKIDGVVAALQSAYEICFVAPAGTGKTTTLVQLAEASVNLSPFVPITIPLSEWSTQSAGLLEYCRLRKAFSLVFLSQFHAIADAGHLLLLLDGWNELDAVSRQRLRADLAQLRRDHPELRLVITTRRQDIDTPLTAATIEVCKLSDNDQLGIARAELGEKGVDLLERAWRTAGVNELISTPLYLSTLLASSPDGALPTTKAKILEQFVRTNEENPINRARLAPPFRGHHDAVLRQIAITGLQQGRSSITDGEAKRAVAVISQRLLTQSEITQPLDPSACIATLVDNHSLLRAGSDLTVSFQHQQFQEWYASQEVERVMREVAQGFDGAVADLRTRILDNPVWEESILFACETLSAKGPEGATAVARSIGHALDIDPLLAAAMIFGSTSETWLLVRDQVLSFCARWHVQGTFDRAVGFMVATGKPDFADEIWALIAVDDNNIRLGTLRAAPRFRVSVLGTDVAARLSTFNEKTRALILSEIAHNSSYDGIEVAIGAARADASSKVKLDTIEALLFRHAYVGAADILRTADDAVWQAMADRMYYDDEAFEIPDIDQRLKTDFRPFPKHPEYAEVRRLTRITRSGHLGPEFMTAVAKYIASVELRDNDRETYAVISAAYNHDAPMIAKALQERLAAGKSIPRYAETMLTSGPTHDHGPLADLALTVAQDDQVTGLAATVAGPAVVLQLLQRGIAIHQSHADTGGDVHGIINSEALAAINRQLSVTPELSFATALLQVPAYSRPAALYICDMLQVHGRNVQPLPFGIPAPLAERVRGLLRTFIANELARDPGDRTALAKLVQATRRVPHESMLGDITKLLEAEQQCRATLQRETEGRLKSNLAMSYYNQYADAIKSAGGDGARAVFVKYLDSEFFWREAAHGLATLWTRANRPEPETNHRGWPDFSQAGLARAQRVSQIDPQICDEAKVILAAATTQLDKTDRDLNRAAELICAALQLPHGDVGAIRVRLPMGDLSKDARWRLATCLVMTGYTLSAADAELLIRDFDVDVARYPHWSNGREYDTRKLLNLLALSDTPEKIIDTVNKVTALSPHLQPWFYRDLCETLAGLPDQVAHPLLRDLAIKMPDLVTEHVWQNAVLGSSSASGCLLIMDLIDQGIFDRESVRSETRWLGEALGAAARSDPALAQALMERCGKKPPSAGKSLYEAAVASLQSVDGVLTLVRSASKTYVPQWPWVHKALEQTSLRHQESATFPGSETIVRRNAAELRKALFLLLDTDPYVGGLAEKCLLALDDIRDIYGRDRTEPRHPFASSGKPWPRLRTP